MRLAGYFLLACVALAALKAAIAALFLAGGVALLWGVLFRPAQTFGLLVLIAVILLLQAHPWAVVGLVALAITSNRREQR